MGRFGRFSRQNNWTTTGLTLAYLVGLALGFYEMTAKSPGLLDRPLPGWWATDRAERTTRWNPPTGFLPLDKLLHEGEEAIRFYRILARP
ncbi:MAG: hypothetical protein ABFS42_03555 [Candidatus Krumholzibacteriota bacterium]